ncbi:glycosyl hydrolase family 18 protein [Hyalangium gracile]|uniref:glycosyl hydrolase family 18 protein n=1 Tax=Hyalangium gracile TaxID=394092 RepID=UPI001CC9D3BB|nr:glycosyl hydrolase family 18 protein [Hyalangium gracile]
MRRFASRNACSSRTSPLLRELVLVLSTALACSEQVSQSPPELSRGEFLSTSGFTFRTTSVWDSGYCAEMRVPNLTGAPINGWTVVFELPSGMTISSLWMGRWSAQGAIQTVRDDTWNAGLAPGAVATFGFCGGHGGAPGEPLSCTLNGRTCGGSTPPEDTQPPSAVSGLSLAGSTPQSIELQWTASTDDTGVTGYEVFQDGANTPVATPAASRARVTGLQPSTSYRFTVKARDAAGNRSAASAPFTATTAAPFNPFRLTSSWGDGYCAEMGVPNFTGAPIHGWTVVFELPPGMTISSLWMGRWSAQGAIQTVRDDTWNAGLAPGAVATFGFCGSHAGTPGEPLSCTFNGLPCSGTAPDTQPPSTVTGIRLVGSTPSGLDLEWSAADDNVRVIGYEVFLNGARTPVAAPLANRVSVAGLQPETSYTFTVKARDAAGNRSAPSAPFTAKTASMGTLKVVGYFVRWGVYGRGFYPKTLDTNGMAAKLTHLNYAFGNVVDGRCVILPSPDGDPWADYQMGFTAADSVDGVADAWNQPLKGNFNQLRKLKARHPHLKVLISLGGWDWSGGFSAAVSTPQKRQAFVQSCIDLYIRGNVPGLPSGAAAGVFDGIDVDWEFPVLGGLFPGRPEDRENFTAMLAEFRRQLDAVRPGLQLSIATGSAARAYLQIRLDLIHPYLDHVNLMTYDMHGGWETTANFHAALYNQVANPSRGQRDSTHEAVQGHLAAGLPASRLVVGVPFYGRGWQGTRPGPRGDGLYQATAGAARGNWDDWSTGNTGMFDYHYIRSTLEPTAVKYRHPEAQVPYLFNASTGLWVSYDDPVSLGVKGDYIRSQGLAGAMIWELSGDDAQGSLVTALKNKLNP